MYRRGRRRSTARQRILGLTASPVTTLLLDMSETESEAVAKISARVIFASTAQRCLRSVLEFTSKMVGSPLGAAPGHQEQAAEATRPHVVHSSFRSSGHEEHPASSLRRSASASSSKSSSWGQQPGAVDGVNYLLTNRCTPRLSVRSNPTRFYLPSAGGEGRDMQPVGHLGAAGAVSPLSRSMNLRSTPTPVSRLG